MIRFMIEKEFEANERSQVFYIDAFDIKEKLLYRFNFEPNKECNLIEVEIEPLTEKGISMKECSFHSFDLDSLFTYINKISPDKIGKIHEKIEKEIKELEQEEIEEQSDKDLLII